MTTVAHGIGHRTLYAAREPRKRRCELPRLPKIHLGMEVVIEVSCDFRGCRGRDSLWHGRSWHYRGVIEQKRGNEYLVVTRLYGQFWAKREHMFTRDHDGRHWTTPLFQEG